MQAHDHPVLFTATWFASGNQRHCIKAGRLTQSPAPKVFGVRALNRASGLNDWKEISLPTDSPRKTVQIGAGHRSISRRPSSGNSEAGRECSSTRAGRAETVAGILGVKGRSSFNTFYQRGGAPKEDNTKTCKHTTPLLFHLNLVCFR